ncbi:MAG TPA: hypothetical protein VMW83_07350 [Spirochaetia bacterium]|nr:hypothetical protein [Spirochaetia bacterium]
MMPGAQEVRLFVVFLPVAKKPKSSLILTLSLLLVCFLPKGRVDAARASLSERSVQVGRIHRRRNNAKRMMTQASPTGCPLSRSG